jgi:hypothetical protein
MLTVFADKIVDWPTIGKVVLASIVAGIGVTAAFSIAVLGATRWVEMRRAGRTIGSSAFAVMGLLGAAVSVAAVVGGIIVMSSK